MRRLRTDMERDGKQLWVAQLTDRLGDWNGQAGKTVMGEEMRLHSFCLSYEKSVCEDEIFFSSFNGRMSIKKEISKSS